MMTTDEMWKQSPPYVSYKTFDKLINNLKELSPSHLDMSYLSDKFSISTGTQLMYAMRYLKLIDVIVAE